MSQRTRLNIRNMEEVLRKVQLRILRCGRIRPCISSIICCFGVLAFLIGIRTRYFRSTHVYTSLTYEPDVLLPIYESKKFHNNRTYKVLWYNPPLYLKRRPEALDRDFSSCPYSNCEMTFNRTDRMVSDAVIYDGRLLKKKDTTERPPGQIWIFAAHESPVAYDDPKGSMWKNGTWRNSFNWTMTYNRWNTDIHLPYGRLRKKIFPTSRNYSFVASMKTDGALMISSDCDTHSKRHEYALELGKYIPVTILGSCGTTWECGQQFVHDDCFDVLNTTFKYYLAFPNAFCTQYFTEKFFDNYNYDIIFIVRGGKRAIEAHKMFPKGTFISAQDFTSAKSLGLYLRRLGESNNKLAQMLATKDIYYSPGYAEVYQNALCDICKRMNFQKRYRKQIKDIELWALGKEPCRVDD